MVVQKLRPEGAVSIDQPRLTQLYKQLGTIDADDVVSRAMEELAVRLAKVGSAYKQKDFEEVQRGGRSMIAISEQIGMTTFAVAAAGVSDTATAVDSVALAATVDRLLRVGENSLLAVWELQGVSI